MLSAKEPSILEDEINRQMNVLASIDVESNDEDYNEQLERVSKLYKIKAENKADRVSKDTLALVGANLLGILLIISTEREHVITSRAMGMLAKPK